MTAPDAVEIIMAGCDAGLAYDEIDELLQERIPGITIDERGTAYIGAGQRMRRQGQAMLQLADEVDQIAAEEGIAIHPKTPISTVLQLAADRGNERAAAILNSLRR